MKRLPNSVQEIADVIGRDDALYLIGKWPKCKHPSRGGESVLLYVPTLSRLTPDHRLVKILGYPLARKLCASHLGGALLKPANCNGIARAFRNKSIVQFWEGGHTISEIAEVFNTTPKYTKKILSDLGYNTEHKIIQVASNDA